MLNRQKRLKKVAGKIKWHYSCYIVILFLCIFNVVSRMGVPAKVLSVIEIILKIALTGAFILALTRSILSLSRGLTTRRNFVGENSHFPAVTFCPFTYVSSRDNAVNTQNINSTFEVKFENDKTLNFRAKNHNLAI